MLSCKSAAIAVLLLSAGILPFAAYAAPDGFAAEVRALLEASYPADGPGAAVIVTENGAVVYEGGRGLADIEAGTPITAETIFLLASITKQFSAATLLLLVDEGQVSLDDPLSRFLPNYPGPGAKVTVRQLLNHTSGIKSYTDIPGWMSEERTGTAITTEGLIAVFEDQPMDFEPGERFAYNNSGYILIGAIIEKVTGKPWYQAVVDRIAQPLALSSIGYGQDEIPPSAKLYTAAEGGTYAPAQELHASVPGAAGGLRGSVVDLAGWANALHNGEVLSSQLYAQMIAPTVLPDGSTELYGFGIAPGELRRRTAIGHSGGGPGISTDSIYLPAEDIFVAVFVNSDSPRVRPGTIMRKIAAMAIDDPYQEFASVTPDLDALDPLFGVYKVGEHGTRQFYAKDGKLYTMRSGGPETEVFAAGEGRFFYGPNSLTWFDITRADDGSPIMEMHQNGAEEIELANYDGPIPEQVVVDVSRAILESYVGTYTTMAGPMVITVTDDDVLMAKLGDQPSIPLAALSDTSFKVTVVDATVSFTSEGSAVTGLVIEQGGQSIPGERVGDTD